MSAQPPEKEICKAVLDFASEGTYPDSEQVVAAELSLPALAKELDLITQARDQVEIEISTLSRDNDFDVDNWISQAKQLHTDLERSRLTAREIVKQHENTKPLQLKVEDASAKIDLVEREIVFNKAVTDTLEEVQSVCQQLDTTRTLYQDDQITAAIDSLEAIEKALDSDSCFKNTNVMGLLQENVATLRQEFVDFLHDRWVKALQLDHKQGKLTVSGNILKDTIAALARMNEFATANEEFQRDLFLAIIDPIVLPSTEGYSHGVVVEDSSIHIVPDPFPASVSDVLSNTAKVFSFIRQTLPASILTPLSDSFIPAVSSKIISNWLSCAIPTELDGLNEFERMLDHIHQFSGTLETLGLHGHEGLISWANQAPRLWLTKRRVDSLDQVRKVLSASKGVPRQVERVEKRLVSDADKALLDNTTQDDWNWDDEKEDDVKKHDEEDIGAWGLDEDADDSRAIESDTKLEADDDDDDGAGDAWGWDEDEDENEDDQPPAGKTQLKKGTTVQPVKDSDTELHVTPREIILMENYTITDVPDSILRIILQQVADSETISQPSRSSTLVSSSGAGLLALPTLILAMFKATASSFYGLKLNASQMYLYNDSLYLAERVRQVATENHLTKLEADVEALEKFGKLAYSKEMQTQRTIVTDLLDGAQGFSQCSEQPFLAECENAVSATVDRVRDVYKEWQPILSHSALLQAVGSLVSTVVDKILIDIEDLGDISESQSQKLVLFCNQLSQLEDLFLPENIGEEKNQPMTAVYVRNWLKFQYLINILESSLADIKFLWKEGELGLEFSGDEVTDLIEALFAESDYRRKAIAEIKRTPRGK